MIPKIIDFKINIVASTENLVATATCGIEIGCYSYCLKNIDIYKYRNENYYYAKNRDPKEKVTYVHLGNGELFLETELKCNPNAEDLLLNFVSEFLINKYKEKIFGTNNIPFKIKADNNEYADNICWCWGNPNCIKCKKSKSSVKKNYGRPKRSNP